LDTLTRSGDIRDRNLKLYEILAQILHVLAPNFFGGGPLELLDLHYKVHPDSDHVAKFHGDRPRELGDLVAKKGKNISSKT